MSGIVKKSALCEEDGVTPLMSVDLVADVAAGITSTVDARTSRVIARDCEIAATGYLEIAATGIMEIA